VCRVQEKVSFRLEIKKTNEKQKMSWEDAVVPPLESTCVVDPKTKYWAGKVADICKAEKGIKQSNLTCTGSTANVICSHKTTKVPNKYLCAKEKWYDFSKTCVPLTNYKKLTGNPVNYKCSAPVTAGTSKAAFCTKKPAPKVTVATTTPSEVGIDVVQEEKDMWSGVDTSQIKDVTTGKTGSASAPCIRLGVTIQGFVQSPENATQCNFVADSVGAVGVSYDCRKNADFGSDPVYETPSGMDQWVRRCKIKVSKPFVEEKSDLANKFASIPLCAAVSVQDTVCDSKKDKECMLTTFNGSDRVFFQCNTTKNKWELNLTKTPVCGTGLNTSCTFPGAACQNVMSTVTTQNKILWCKDSKWQ
jgi:hypothetical protein